MDGRRCEGNVLRRATGDLVSKWLPIDQDSAEGCRADASTHHNHPDWETPQVNQPYDNPSLTLVISSGDRRSQLPIALLASFWRLRPYTVHDSYVVQCLVSSAPIPSYLNVKKKYNSNFRVSFQRHIQPPVPVIVQVDIQSLISPNGMPGLDPYQLRRPNKKKKEEKKNQ